MADPFKNREEIKAWLETQPRDVISVFAARAALRGIFRFSDLKVDSALLDNTSDWILIYFWATSVSLSAGAWPNVITPQYGQFAYMAAKFTETVADEITKNDSHTLANALYSASFAADTAIYKTNAARAASLACPSPDILLSQFDYAELSADKTSLINGKTAQQLAKTKLWSKTTIDFDKYIAKSWAVLKAFLLEKNEYWWVWTDWYEDRLRGNEDGPFTIPFVKDIELGIDPLNEEYGRNTLPVDFYPDPAKANTKIAEIIEAYKAQQKTLEQDTASETFEVNANGQIGRTTAQTSPILTDTPEQSDWYESLRDSALGMRDIGENALGRAARPVNSLIKALPESIGEARVAKLWPAANRIRKLKAAHERAAAGPEEYHPNLLGSEVVDDINQFVEVYNNFVVGDAGLSEKDRNTAGPQDPETEIEASEAATEAINTVLAHGLFTDDAKIVIQETVDESVEINSKLKEKSNLTVLEKLALDNTRREKENALRAIIMRVRDGEKYEKIEDGILAGIGLTIVGYVNLVWPALGGLVKTIFGL